MRLYHKALLYQNKWIQPYIHIILNLIDSITFLAAVALIIGVVYEHGFIISSTAYEKLEILYKAVWISFLTNVTAHLLLEYKGTKKKYRSLAWFLSVIDRKSVV